MYKIYVYIPETHLATVKNAMFNAGAGDFGQYDHCCWQIKGQGQYRALPGSNPHVGQVAEETQLDEYKVELICSKKVLKSVINAMLDAHPYEEVAYGVIELVTFSD